MLAIRLLIYRLDLFGTDRGGDRTAALEVEEDLGAALALSFFSFASLSATMRP